jgi:putative ABC transport system ATP-binding protein
MALVELQKVEKIYALGDSRIHALRGIDLWIGKGEFVAVWGPSGSGKSTLCNLVGMLDVPSNGRVLLEGRDVSSLSEEVRADFRSRSLGFIFQNFNLIPVLTALENVMLPLQIAGRPVSSVRDRAAERLTRLGLGGHLSHRPDKLSGGQQQRVAIARALISDPALVVADEPTANLDSETAVEIIDMLRSINRANGTTFLISTHDQRLLGRVDRRILLRDGTIAEDAIQPTEAARK